MEKIYIIIKQDNQSVIASNQNIVIRAKNA